MQVIAAQPETAASSEGSQTIRALDTLLVTEEDSPEAVLPEGQASRSFFSQTTCCCC
jgi:hypothetical protein